MGEMPDVHSCNEVCQRPLCVREREILDLRRRLRVAERAKSALPRPWSTVAELEALPVGSVVTNDDASIAWFRDPAGGWRGTNAEWASAGDIDGPGIILFVGGGE